MNKGHSRWLMLLGCLALLGVVSFLFWPTTSPAVGRQFNGSSLVWLLILACPLMHVLMMFGHKHEHGARDRSSESGASETRPPQASDSRS